MWIYFEIHLTDYYRIKSRKKREKNETHHIDDNTFSAHINASTPNNGRDEFNANGQRDN